MGNPSSPGILEVIMDWPEGKDFRLLPEEDMTCAEETPPYHKLPENFHSPPHPSRGKGNRATAWPFVTGHDQTATCRKVLNVNIIPYLVSFHFVN